MIESLKKFFKNKKTDAAFKRAGPGHKLNETSQCLYNSREKASCSTNMNCHSQTERTGLAEESKQAASAALARLDKQKNNKNSNKSFASMREKVKQEIMAEELAINSATKKSESKNTPETKLIASPVLAVEGVFFECPLLGPDILTKEEWKQKIREFLYNQLEEEKGLAACLIIHTLNENTEMVNSCIDTIIKYFENIINHPTEEKYRKIRMNNKIFEEKVKPIEGALILLEAAGFEVKELSYQDSKENFLVYPSEKLPDAPNVFEILIDGLKSAMPITLELHRNLKVLLPSEAMQEMEFPDSFFQLTPKEIEREQSLRMQVVEQNLSLRTKAMREKDEIQIIRKYKFTLIRIRFPDGMFLQGTFGVQEKISMVWTFIRKALEDENLNFKLFTPDKKQIMENSESTLVELKLVPASLLILATEIKKKNYLKPEILMLMQPSTVSQ